MIYWRARRCVQRRHQHPSRHASRDDYARGHAHPITSRSRIGRSHGGSPVTDGNASRRHAEIAARLRYVLVDLGSTNGTELNGRRVTREELADGDTITIGATDLVFGRSRP
jgi:pSer/pThr/pTyr-binding forkhead associated (FHA) protein